MESKLINEFLNTNNISKASIKGYLYDLNTFVLFMMKRNHINNLDNEADKDLFLNLNSIDMYAYVDYLKKNLKIQIKLSQEKYLQLKTFINFLIKNMV